MYITSSQRLQAYFGLDHNLRGLTILTTIADFFTSIREDMLARYRSPILVPALISITACHWKIVVYLLTESHKSADAIAFIQANTSFLNLVLALVSAFIYVTMLPWLEFSIEWLASKGRRRRNEFQTREKEQEIARQKFIAQEEAKALELILKNTKDESKITDIELARNYQNIIAGENFSRWLVDLERGAENGNLHGVIANYLTKFDSTEGKFVDLEVQAAHAHFVEDLSTMFSALDDQRINSVMLQQKKAGEFAKKAQASQKEYRELVRKVLGV